MNTTVEAIHESVHASLLASLRHAAGELVAQSESVNSANSANSVISSIVLQQPADEAHGNWATNAALVLAHQLSKSPRDIAEALAQKLRENIADHAHHAQYVADIAIAGPGFINITLNDAYYAHGLNQALLQAQTYGTSTAGSDKTVIVEYSSPNIAKPFTVGHLRSTIIGDAVANLLEYAGWQVLRDNHLGDWGTQFGKQICAIKKWGDEQALAQSTQPIKDLVNLYVRFHKEAEEDPSLEDEARAWFKKLEDGDAEARRIWQLCVSWSLGEFSRIYKQLGVSFSREFNDGAGLGESYFEDKMQPVLALLAETEYLQKGEQGAQLFFFPNDALPPAMIVKKDGTSLYHTRDLATDWYRKQQYNPDLIINEVGSEQSLYFRQLFAMEALLGWYTPEQRVHIGHGMIRFKDKKMSTRKGDVIWLSDVLDQACERARKLAGEENELAVAIGALKWNDLKGTATRDIAFDWDEMLTMQGNSGPYVQYAHARCCSLVDRANAQGIDASVWEQPIKNASFSDTEALLARELCRFPEITRRSAAEYAPHLLAGYLYELAQRYNAFYATHSVLGDGVAPQQTAQRLQLTAATALVLKTGLTLLGIAAPRSM